MKPLPKKQHEAEVRLVFLKAGVEDPYKELTAYPDSRKSERFTKEDKEEAAGIIWWHKLISPWDPQIIYADILDNYYGFESLDEHPEDNPFRNEPN